jgi:hypothetical protein
MVESVISDPFEFEYEYRCTEYEYGRHDQHRLDFYFDAVPDIVGLFWRIEIR